MTKTLAITPEQKTHLLNFLKKNKNVTPLMGYCAFLEDKYHLKLVICPRENVICQTMADMVEYLESEGKLWRQTECAIQYSRPRVDEDTKQIYICPHCNWAVGDNTKYPTDAICDHVKKCPKNTEKIGGLPSDRFTISKDPQEIKKHIPERKSQMQKVVFTSHFDPKKVFISKQAVIDDFKKSYAKPASLNEAASAVLEEKAAPVIEEKLKNFINQHIQEFEAFIQSLSECEEFVPYLKKWENE
jgi:hypothetical protein